MLAAVTLFCCPWHHVNDDSDFAVVVSHGVTVLWRKAIQAPLADSNLIQLPVGGGGGGVGFETGTLQFQYRVEQLSWKSSSR
jgi:hypothetical protein